MFSSWPLLPNPQPPRDGSETKETLLQAWISGWFLRTAWVLVKTEFSQIESSWVFQLHALIAAETWDSKSLRRLHAGLDSLEAERAGQGQHGPRPSNCLWLGSAARPSTEGPGCVPQDWEGTIMTKNDTTCFLEKHTLGHWGLQPVGLSGTPLGFLWAVLLGRALSVPDPWMPNLPGKVGNVPNSNHPPATTTTSLGTVT